MCVPNLVVSSILAFRISLGSKYFPMQIFCWHNLDIAEERFSSPAEIKGGTRSECKERVQRSNRNKELYKEKFSYDAYYRAVWKNIVQYSLLQKNKQVLMVFIRTYIKINLRLQQNFYEKYNFL